MSNQSFIPLSTNTAQHSTHCSIHSSHRIRMKRMYHRKTLHSHHCFVCVCVYILLALSMQTCVWVCLCIYMSESDVFVTFIFRFICLVLVLAHLHLPSRLFRFYHFIFSHFHSMFCMCNVSALLVCVRVYNTPYVRPRIFLYLDCLCAQSQCFIITIYVSWVYVFFFGWLEQSEKLMVFCVYLCMALPFWNC